jgi:DegV family protein with EDD domain
MTEPRIAIVTDSTADLPADLRNRHGISVVPIGVRFGEETLRDGIDIGPEGFLARLAQPGPLPRTVAPAPDQFADLFRELGKRHDGVVAVVGSSKLGTTAAAALQGRQLVMGVPVEVVDSRSATMGLGWQAVRAAELAGAGMDLAAIADILRVETSRYEVVFFVDTLEHLRRGGRIGRAATMIGEALDLKPLLRIDEGQVVPLDRARTYARAVDALVAAVKEMGTVEHVAALHSSDAAAGRMLAAKLIAEAELDPSQVVVACIGPGVATHIGPGALGVAVADIPG